MSELIPESFDELMQSEDQGAPEKEKTLKEKFEGERLKWGGKIKEMSQNLKGNIEKVAELQASVYTERQIALEYYHYLISVLSGLNKSWNIKYSNKWKYYSYEGDVRYPNEREKAVRINADLADAKEQRELVDNHAKFMDGTIKTIDNIIFGLKTRVEIEQIKRGR